jgi:PIN domain nuclease of toxin-antitoxin system
LKLLLDSNAFLWAYERPRELSAIARRAMEDPGNTRFLSIASLWEMSIKLSTGKLTFKSNFDDAVGDLAAAVLPITLAHAERVRHLPFHHRDPFDRMLIAQALEEGLTIITRDRQFEDYGVSLLKA